MGSENENRLLKATIVLLQRVEDGTIDSSQAAQCIENSLVGLETKLSKARDLSAQRIEDIGIFSVRARRTLARANIDTIGQLTALSLNKLRNLPSCGLVTECEIQNVLQRLDLKLFGEE